MSNETLQVAGEAMLSALRAHSATLPDERGRGHSLRKRVADALARLSGDGGEPLFYPSPQTLKGRGKVGSSAIRPEGDPRYARGRRGATATGRVHIMAAIGDRFAVREVYLACIAGLVTAAWGAKPNSGQRADAKDALIGFLGVLAVKTLGLSGLSEALSGRPKDSPESPFERAVTLAEASRHEAFPGASKGAPAPKVPAYGFLFVFGGKVVQPPAGKGRAAALKALLREGWEGEMVTLGDWSATVTRFSAAELAEQAEAERAALIQSARLAAEADALVEHGDSKASLPAEGTLAERIAA